MMSVHKACYYRIHTLSIQVAEPDSQFYRKMRDEFLLQHVECMSIYSANHELNPLHNRCQNKELLMVRDMLKLQLMRLHLQV